MLTPSISAAISADYASLISLFARKLGNLAQAEDLVSAAFLESLEKLAKQQIADTTRFSGFVYGVAFNLLRNHRRRIDNRLDTRAADFVLDSLPSESATPDEELSKAALSVSIREMIQELPAARDRELVLRFYLHEETKEHICREMGLGSLHFDKVLFRARGRLRRIVERKGIYSGPERRIRVGQAPFKAGVGTVKPVSRPPSIA
jgi:RNA polymerase sigma-70 factor, ECF subfamily